MGPPKRDEIAHYRKHERGERARIYLPTQTIIAVENIVGLDSAAVSEWIDNAIRRRISEDGQ
jgi:hypothetical protein